MPKTIEELRKNWETNQDSYKVHEIGNFQRFIADIFESGELFKLKLGDLRKDNKKRKEEFTLETSKENRRADMVVFIDGDDIVIPVEVEKYGNIKAGVSQILQYQTDWRKKYGILTDGNEWRLYYDRWYETFNIQDIFDTKSRFWKKWQLYTAPETYYDMAFNPKGQQELFEAERLNPCISENRPFFFNDITTLLRTFKNKISALVPLFANEDRQAIETTYSYVIQFILYKVLIDNNYKKLENDYEVFRNDVKKAIQTKKYGEIIHDIKNISEYIYKNIYEPFRQKQEDINKRLIEQLEKTPTLDEIAPWLDIVMFIDRYNFSDMRNELFGFVYENYLKELYHDENKGQYFTDPAVVNFMLQELGYTKEALAKTGGKNISIIDPSCGAGTFLYSAAYAIKEAFDKGTMESSKLVEELVNDNIFGLDIEEFPLFLAEMNILMQLLPVVVGSNYSNVINDKLKLFITKDSIAEFLDTPINNGKDEEEYEKGLFDEFDNNNTPTYMRDRKDLVDMFTSLEGDLDGRQRFDFVIGNPPYIALNRCGNLPFTKLMKEKKSISMGDVYHVNLHSVPNNRKKYPPKPNLYAFFISLGFALLKNKGKICYIVPQNILSTGDLDVIRYYLAMKTTIEKIIIFPNPMFVGRGIKQKNNVATSSLVFVAKKEPPRNNHKIEVTNYNSFFDKEIPDFDQYLKSRNKTRFSVMQNDLQDNIENWSFIQQDTNFLKFSKSYSLNTENISIYSEHKLAEPVFKSTFWFDVGFILNKKLITNNSTDAYPVLDFKRCLGYSVFTFDKYYPRNREKIGLTKNSQGYDGLGHKYHIVWRIKNFIRFHFTDNPVIFNMGAAAFISSDNKNELLYLFALLNSPLNGLILLQNLKKENEKEFLVSIKSIKQYIRVPRITPENKNIKAEIIKQTQSMLDLENNIIKDFVDFPRTSLQIFDSVRIAGNDLILISGDSNYKAKISRGKSLLVQSVIEKKYFSKTPLVPDTEINIREIKFLPVIDFEEQAKLKTYIDDLVFALYFNVEVSNVNFAGAASIHNFVYKNRFYKLISNIDIP